MPKKQTSDRVAQAASYLMRALQEFGASVELTVYVPMKGSKTRFRRKRADVTELVEAVAASALSQDETKGKRRPKKKGPR